MTPYNFLPELAWRGMLHQSIPGTGEHLAKTVTRGYIGFDPTAPSLHIGSLATIMLLRHLQKAGHQPVVLIGGATSLAGDPSFKAQERALLDESIIQVNATSIQGQLERLLDPGQGGAPLVLNNQAWFKDMSLFHFLRDVGKHFPISYMVAKESVKRRVATGLSYTEFTYQLLQGYDFYYLYTHYGVELQMGGSDQWGNLTSGTELIRRKGGGNAFAVTTPLLTKEDGSKFGKTESGNIWLDPEKTSPYAFYQFWVNVSDEEAERLIKVFTLWSQEEIENCIGNHRAAPHRRQLQKQLAEEMTTWVHGASVAAQVIRASNLLFGKSTLEDWAALDEALFRTVLEEAPVVSITQGAWESTPDVLTLLSTTTEGKIFPSKSEAQRMLQGGGVMINQEKVMEPQAPLPQQLLHRRYVMVRIGKKHHYLIEVF